MRKPVFILCLFITSVVACKKEDDPKPTPTPTPTPSPVESLVGTYVGAYSKVDKIYYGSIFPDSVDVDSISFLDTVYIVKISDSSFRIDKDWGVKNTEAVFTFNASNSYSRAIGWSGFGIGFYFNPSADSLTIIDGGAHAGYGSGYSTYYNYFWGKKQ